MMLAATVQTQQVDRPAALRAQIDRIFKERAYAAPRFGPARWLPDGTAYAIVEQPKGGSGSEIARYDAVTGARTVLLESSRLRASRPENTAQHRRLRVVGGRQATAHLHEHAESVAGQHPRRLLGARRRSGALRQLWVNQQIRPARRAELPSADVREVLARRAARRLRSREQHLRRAPGHRQSDGSSRRDGSETTINGTSDWVYEEELGVRDCFPLEPRRPAHRLLAVRHDRRRHLLADQRHDRALSDDHADPVSEGRDDELRRAHRRRQRWRRHRHAGCRRPAIRETAISPASSGSTRDASRCSS